MRKLALLLLLNISLLFAPSPGPQDTVCGRYVHLTGYAGFTLNADTYGFIKPAIRPGMLFEPQSQRQSRPLFILAGSAAGYTWYYITLPFKKYLYNLYSSFSRGIYPQHFIYPFGTFYISFVLLNLLVLWLSLYVFEKIYLLVQGKRDVAMYALMVLIASNPVTKGFIWAVHQQMFTLLTPLWCVYVLMKMNKRESVIPFTYSATMAFAGGLLLLVYGNFLMLLPTLLVGFNLNYTRHRPGYRWLSLTACNALLILLFLLPTMSWIGLLKINGITYYSFEFGAYRQLVWIKDLLSISPGAFFSMFAQHTISYLGTMKDVLIILAGSGVVWWVARARPKMDNHVMAVLVVLGLFFIFYWLLGFYANRLTFVLVPVICCLLVVIGKQTLHQKPVPYILIASVLAWHLYVLFSKGPFC
jgi:hypothetical protein